MGRDALHPAPRQMNTLATQIQELAVIEQEPAA